MALLHWDSITISCFIHASGCYAAFYGAAVLVEMPFFRDCNFFCVRLHAVLLVQLKRLVLGTLGWSTVIVMASLVLEHCKLKHGKLRDFV